MKMQLLKNRFSTYVKENAAAPFLPPHPIVGSPLLLPPARLRCAYNWSLHEYNRISVYPTLESSIHRGKKEAKRASMSGCFPLPLLKRTGTVQWASEIKP